MIQACRSQLRVGGTGAPFGLDFGAVMAVGAALGVDAGLLAGALPQVEAAVLAGLRGEED